MPNRTEILKQKYQDSLGLPFAQVLNEHEIQQVLDDQNVSYRRVPVYADSSVVGLDISDYRPR
ncbi:MAG: hypothetical protein AAGA46_09150 [Cyanobacteria bacterium P01_F01_bin.13]